MIPASFVEDMLSRIDIVDLIGQHVTMKSSGREHLGLCPFHGEKTPSFRVYPKTQHYHCFGCGRHDNAIGFVMEYFGMGFVDAVRMLAESVGMTVPEAEHAVERRVARAPLTELMAKAAEFYRGRLKSSPEAMAYLASRGISEETAIRYGLGFAPDGWSALQAVFSEYKDPALVEVGLVAERNDSRYDFFRNRLLFPVMGSRGDIIAFGGRTLGDDPRKYINSPQTPLFDKGREIYGLLQARQAMREQNAVYVFEGYMDVLTLAQAGVGNAVAVMGTAPSESHLQQLMRAVTRIIFCFDGDRGGLEAARRAAAMAVSVIEDGKMVQFVFLPEGEDPDSLVRSKGVAAFNKLAQHPMNLSEFLLRQARASSDLDSIEGRAAFVVAMAPTMKVLASGKARTIYAQIRRQVAKLAEVQEAELEERWGTARPVGGPKMAPAVVSVVSSLEASVLRSIVQCPVLTPLLPRDVIEDGTPEGAALKAIADIFAQGGNPGTAALMEILRGTDVAAVLRAAIDAVGNQTDEESVHRRVVEDAVLRFRQRAIEQRLRALGPATQETIVEFMALTKERHAIQKELTALSDDTARSAA